MTMKNMKPQTLKYIALSSLLMLASIAAGYWFQKNPGSFFLFNCRFTTVPPILTLGFCAVLYTLKKAMDADDEESSVVMICIRMSGFIILVAVVCQIVLLLTNVFRGA